MNPTKNLPAMTGEVMTGGKAGAGGASIRPHHTTAQPRTQEATSKPAQVRSVVLPLYVPDELAQQDRWVNWRYGLNERGDIAKIPVNSRSLNNAASNRPSTWATLDKALDTYNRAPRKVSGIGYNQHGSDVVGIDLDGVIDDDGNLLPRAADIVSRFNTYTEVSPSGRGIRMFGRGRKPGKHEKRGGVELYDGTSTRYLTFTGNHLPGTPLDVVDVTQPLAELYAETFGAEDDAAPPTPPTPAQPVNLDDAELLARAIAAKNGGRFAALWQGDASMHSSASEADYALVGALLFWTAGDVARVDNLFRSSGLMREKWDARRGERTYGQMTIAKCASGQTQYYTPPQPRPANVTAAGEVIEPPSVQDLWRILHQHVKHDGEHCDVCGKLVTWERETATTVSGGVRCFRCKRRDCMDWQTYRAKQIIVQSDIHTWPEHYVTKLPVADYDRMVDRGVLRDLVQWFAVLEQDDVVLVASSEVIGSLSIATRLDALAPTMAQAWLSRKPGSRLRDPKKAARAKRETITCDAAKPAPVVAAVDDEPVVTQRKAAFGLIDLDPVDVVSLLDIIAAAGGDVDHKRRKWSYPVELKTQVHALVSQWRDVAGLGGRLEIDAYPNQPTEYASISSTPLCEQPDWPNMTAEQQEYARLTVHRDANHDSIERETQRM